MEIPQSNAHRGDFRDYSRRRRRGGFDHRGLELDVWGAIRTRDWDVGGVSGFD